MPVVGPASEYLRAKTCPLLASSTASTSPEHERAGAARASRVEFLDRGIAGASGESAGRRRRYADARKGSWSHPGEHALHGAEILSREREDGVYGGKQCFRGPAGGDGDFGEHLGAVSAGEGDGGYGGRGIEGQDQQGVRRSAAGPWRLMRRVVGVSW